MSIRETEGVTRRASWSGTSRMLCGSAVICFAVFLGGIRSYIVMSGSMEPAIPTGSICLVNTRVPYDAIGEGDVIAFYRGKALITHRVIAVVEGRLETKGDANACSDGIAVVPSNYHGKTIAAIPYVGYMVSFIQRPEVAGITALLLGMMAIWWFHKTGWLFGRRG